MGVCVCGGSSKIKGFEREVKGGVGGVGFVKSKFREGEWDDGDGGIYSSLIVIFFWPIYLPSPFRIGKKIEFEYPA